MVKNEPVGKFKEEPIPLLPRTVMKTYAKKVFKKNSLKSEPKESIPLKKQKLKETVNKSKKVNRKLEDFFEKQKEYFENVDKEVSL